MAAGLTIGQSDLNLFEEAFEQCCSDLLGEDDLNLIINVDESILDDSINFDTVRKIDMSIWGQGFQAPLYFDKFEVIEQSILDEKHLRCQLSFNGNTYDGMIFNHVDTLPDKIKTVYSIESNEFRGNKKIQLILRDLI